MSLRIRLLLLLLTIYCVGGYYLTDRALEQVRPRYLESMEETLVDTSVLLASVVETQLREGQLETDGLQQAFIAARRHDFQAKVYSLNKTAVDLCVYVTDTTGRVVFDSTGRDVGRDYSQWIDVKRTLLGQYGARSSRTVAKDDRTQSIYVAAPIWYEDQLVGVLSVGKPTTGINQLVEVAKQRLIYGAVLGGVVILLLILLVAAWVIAPLERLTTYARAVRDGKPAALPSLPGRTLHVLGTAFEEMRDALEGRQHVERYTQALAHEVKAPLAAIRGAAELMDESMPSEQRQKFLANIRNESARIQQIVDRLLELSSLEARKTLRQTEVISVEDLLSEAVDVLRPAYAAAKVTLTGEAESAHFSGERVLLREALINLLQNALEFSPVDGSVKLRAKSENGRVVFSVEDSGPGVPDYALARVFERFYSLPRPGTGQKSTGLGLALVREIAHLHGGEVTLANRPEGGARATFWVPEA